MATGIYRITNKINDKVYIGQSWDVDYRLYNHKHNKKDDCIKLQNAFDKYGKENFIFEHFVDGLTTQEQLDWYEIFWIKTYDSISNGYNIRIGGSRGKHSDETKVKMKTYHQNRPKEHQDALNDSIRSDERREQAKIAMIDRWDETKPGVIEKKKELSERMLGNTHGKGTTWTNERKEAASKRMLGNKFRLGLEPINKGTKKVSNDNNICLSETA